jgi:hypothetical protein
LFAAGPHPDDQRGRPLAASQAVARWDARPQASPHWPVEIERRFARWTPSPPFARPLLSPTAACAAGRRIPYASRNPREMCCLSLESASRLRYPYPSRLAKGRSRRKPRGGGLMLPARGPFSAASPFYILVEAPESSFPHLAAGLLPASFYHPSPMARTGRFGQPDVARADDPRLRVCRN